MIWVDVDFNALDGSHRLLASQKFASAILIPGDTVAVVDDVEEMRFEAEVLEVEANGQVLLKIWWDRPLSADAVLGDLTASPGVSGNAILRSSARRLLTGLGTTEATRGRMVPAARQSTSTSRPTVPA